MSVAHYIARPHEPDDQHPGVQLKRCSKCARLVDVHGPTLNQRLDMLGRQGITLKIMCQDCATTLDADTIIALVPSEEEFREANP